MKVDEATARLQELATINHYYGTCYTLAQLDDLEDAQISEMVTLAEGLTRG